MSPGGSLVRCDAINAIASAVKEDRNVRGFVPALARGGVKRFIPSGYRYDFLNLADGESLDSDWRREFARLTPEGGSRSGPPDEMNGCSLANRVLFGLVDAIDLDKGAQAAQVRRQARY